FLRRSLGPLLLSCRTEPTEICIGNNSPIRGSATSLLYCPKWSEPNYLPCRVLSAFTSDELESSSETSVWRIAQDSGRTLPLPVRIDRRCHGSTDSFPPLPRCLEQSMA